ncbi:hypothetical protein O181_032770 [Austropuccinia psidii MF-1]|uniref:Uncharacterized protein n=1 Tax=Austropuccinia psidii MF-1 TaxID=1389203 RepID=A0A9Q3D1P8_9BASI|nr:hypothetical protein [Austropuccinia psidii MF-1]
MTRKGLTIWKLLPKVPFKTKFNQVQPKIWTDAGNVTQMHLLQKYLFTWSMEKKNYHGSIMRKSWNNESENLTQPNVFPPASESDKKLKYQQIFHTLGRERSLNKRKSRSNSTNRELLAYGRAQSDPATSGDGGRNSIFPKTVQQ